MIVLRYIYSFICWSSIILSTIFCGSLSIASTIFSPSGAWSHRCMRWWGKIILFVCCIRVDVQGIENISREEVQLFASNHQSFFDIWVLCSILPVRFGWIIKKEISKIPFLRGHMRINQYITIDRSDREKAIASMDEAAEQIRNGSRIIIFPEGTRSHDEKLGPMKKGIIHLCIKTQVPVVPIYIEGTGRILKSGSRLITSGPVYVTVGKPMPTAGFNEENLDMVIDKFKGIMEALERETKERAGTY